MARKAKVTWTADEEGKVADTLFELWLESPEKGIGPALVQTAQRKALPEHRRRIVSTYAMAKHAIDSAAARAKKAVKLSLTPAPERVIEKPVPVPVDVDEVLREVSLPRLAAALASREMEMKVQFYGNGHSNKSPQTNVDLGVPAAATKTDVTALYPKVVLVGLRPFLVTELKEKLARHPVSIIHAIDPSAPPSSDAFMLRVKPYLALDSDKTPEAWKVVVNTAISTHQIEPDKVIKAYGPERLRTAILAMLTTWRHNNPEAARLHDSLP